MPPLFVGIAGGSGAGKSTLCTALQEKYPQVGLIQLDDYFKPRAHVPVLEDHENWDHPDALFWDKLVEDLDMLSQGKSVIINTKNERLNPEYKHTDQRIPVEFVPKPIMLVEGYLVLLDARVRRFFSTSIWLDVDHSIRWSRRVHFKHAEYEQKVLKPMFEKYALPTKQHAVHIIDVTSLTKEQVLEKVEPFIFGQQP